MTEPKRWTQDEIQNIIYQWLDLVVAKVEADEGPYQDQNFVKIAAAAPALKLASTKSNYLFRRLSLGEKHRTRLCPKHKGLWSGYAGDCPCECSLGWGDITGWLPEPGDEDLWKADVQE